MKARFDLGKSLQFGSGPGLVGAGSLRYVSGELDPATGIVWLDTHQPGTGSMMGKTIQAGHGVHLASRTTVQRLPEAEKAAAKAKPVKDAQPTS